MSGAEWVPRNVSALDDVQLSGATPTAGAAFTYASGKWRDKLAREQIRKRDAGWFSENYNALNVVSETVVVDGTLYGYLVPFIAGDRITNVLVHVGTVGASGITLFKAAVFSLDGNTRHGVTGDVKASILGSSRPSLALAVAYDVVADGCFYVCFLAVKGGGTLPIMARDNAGETMPTASGGAKVALVVAGLSDMPTTLTGNALTNRSYWVGCS